MVIPSDQGKVLECASMGTCVREILEGESTKISGVCSFEHMYIRLDRLVLVMKHYLGTLRELLG